MIAIHAEKLFDGIAMQRDRAVLVEGARIIGVVAPGDVPAQADIVAVPAGSVLAPGFVDLQVNGGGGVLFNNAPAADTLRTIAAAHAGAGTTAILPTLISGTRHELRAALAAVHDAMAQAAPGIVGLHLEGPFIALSRRGIHPAAAITTMSDADLTLLCATSPGKLLLTLAPEAVPARHIIRLVAAGLTVFAGHTDATYEQVLDGLAAGLSGFTHLYNAMSGFAGRAPGAIGAALDHAASHAGIIVDGHHTHDASVRIAYAAKGPDRLFLVSDAMSTAASDLRSFVFNGERIHLEAGRLVNAAGTLAGAHLTMDEALRNAVHRIGIPLDAALRMATATPAAAIGLADSGRVAPGYVADLVVLDTELSVTAVWQAGTVVRQAAPYNPACDTNLVLR